jgi:hypothetical protein
MAKTHQMAKLIAIIFGTIVLRRPVLLTGQTASSVGQATPP